MTVIDDHGRPEPPVDGDEAETLVGFLEYQRATFEWKCRGLDAAGLNATVGASTMTLGGMLKHLALVEEGWFSKRLGGHEPAARWADVDWDADPDWEWHSAVDDTPDELRAIWRESVTRSRAEVADALAGAGLAGLSKRAHEGGTATSLRWILCHMIEEYARHNGHADLIRESVDGETGE